jgi:hypothetical protein
MSCKACQSANHREFPAEINVHFPGYGNLTKPTVWLFPKLLVCLDCGFTKFVIGEAELRQLRNPDLPADPPRREVS